jgi:DNA helicase-2/ATP-dependent DNA helicase PcrA
VNLVAEFQLNPEQRRAVEYQKGPLLIIAGAGTGKTTVVTRRIIHLLTDRQVSPSSIVGLTFTEKAAGEMLGRIDARMPLGYQEPWISTFHAFGERILRREAFELGLDPGYRILTPVQQWLLIRQNLYRFPLDYYRPLGNPTRFVSALITFFSRAKNEVITPEELLKTAIKRQRRARSEAEKEEGKKLLELARAYETYQNLLTTENALDFGDLIFWTIRLFRTRPSVLERYRRTFSHILVDEFQDTNVAQYELVKLLAPPPARPNLTVVADDDQSIFRWRHASLYNTLEFKSDYPEAEVVSLTTNYRSTQKILDHAYRLIRFNNPDRLEEKLKISKKLISTRGKGEEPHVLWGGTVEAESELVGQKIVEMVKKGYSFQEIAILARANNHLDPFVSALKRIGIPYSLVGNRGLFEQAEVKIIYNALRAIADPRDDAAFYAVSRSSFFGVEAEELTEMVNLARKKKEPLYEVARRIAVKASPLHRLLTLLARLHGRVHRDSTTSLLYDFIVESGLADRFLAEETVENQLRVKNLNLFYDRVKSFERESGGANLWDFLDYWEQLLEAGENPAQAEIEDVDTVKLLTVHSAKGLEFPVVFVVNLVRDRFPTRRRGESLSLPDELVKEGAEPEEAHLQEERRLFYVAATRARDHLFLTGADNYGGVREKAPSRFLREFLGKKREEIVRKGDLGLFERPAAVLTGRQQLPVRHPEVRQWSYSRLETYFTCPLQYYYKYVLQFPGRTSFQLSFGQVIHLTLKSFHQRDLFGKRKDLETLLDTYEGYFRTISEGYTSPEHKEEQFAKGKKFLSRYYEVHEEVLGEPLELEKSFEVKVGDYLLAGRIDRIDRRRDGTIELVDYKVSPAETLSKRVKKDRQLTIYALGAKRGLGLEASSLSLYSVLDNKRVSTKRSLEDIEVFEKEAIETIGEIKESDYPARVGIYCRWCDYRFVCPAYKASKKIG